MPIDTTVTGSPGWWLDRLSAKLAGERERCDRLDSYYRNEAGIPVHADKAVRAAYRRLMQMARTNFAELVVEAVRERMKPVGFRTGASSDELGDAEAWRMWQANSLDADHALVDRASLAMGMAYVIVGGVDEELGAPLITPEDPREVTVQTAPGRRRRVIAALKTYRDDVAAVERAYVFLPGKIYRAVRESAAGAAAPGEATGWEWESREELTGLAGVVPVVPIVNRADMAGNPQGEFEPHISLLDRINYSVLNRLEVATLQAFRQRAIKGVPVTDAEGNSIDYDDIFSADPGALWQLPATAEIWESGIVDLTPIRQGIRDDIQDLAAVSRTPLFYLTPEGANGSAEGASLAREGLVFKAYDRLAQTGEAWEQVMALAFRVAGDEVRASRQDMEIIWAPPERFSLAERYDAASKAQAAGVPWRTVMTDVLQFSPQQVDRMETERAADLLLSGDELAP